MRITNNMMIKNTSININGNKINVDTLNNQMTSQKKIQRPSENPVIAIRALRLRSSLSEIDQYYENNIPDAESWLDVTQTAMLNMEKVVKDIRTQCVYGATDSLKEDDRSAILTQLTKLRDQIYSEGNTDYAGRTVFTGYRTNKKLTFMEDEANTSYHVTQKFSYTDLQEYRYYSGNVTLPTTVAEVAGNAIPNPQMAVFERIRLSYDSIDSITDKDGKVLDGTTGNIEGVLTYTDPAGAAGEIKVKVYDTYDAWVQASGGTPAIPEAGTDKAAVFIKESGELVLGDKAAAELRGKKANLNIDYDKTGFGKGELRPEYYYNCTDNTVAGAPVEFFKFDPATGEEIYQDINYVVSANQTLTVNTQGSAVFDAALGRDVDELIDAVQHATEANKKVGDIEAMLKMEEYASDESQEKLQEWLEAAKKERDYANDHMQKLYNSYIGNCDQYLQKINLALTDLGSKGVSLDLTKNRMSNQQTTMETLMSTNEDRNLSDIIIDYTSAYTSYQAALQAGAKINQNTLLNYL